MNGAGGAAAVIGKSVKIRGEVKGSEDLLVDGQVEGSISLTESRLTIGPHAQVNAHVSARDVIVVGRMVGDVRATGRVELRNGCDLAGDIWAARLSVEENAIFRGKVDLVQGTDQRAANTPQPTLPAKSVDAENPLFGAPVSKQ